MGAIDQDELYHYGVLGMKWGVRRTPEQLGRKVATLSRKNESLQKTFDKSQRRADKYFSKSNDIKIHNAKLENKIARKSVKKNRVDSKIQKMNEHLYDGTDWNKLSKKQNKSNELGGKIDKLQNKLKSNPYESKYEKYNAMAQEAQRKIQKNENLMRVYNQTIDAIDSGTIQQGKYFMKYVD